MNKNDVSRKRNSLICLLFFVSIAVAQQPQLPKNATKTQQKVLTPVRPLVKKDSITYVAASVTATASRTFATADELYIQQGTFIIRTATDYRYLTIKDPAPTEASIAFLWSYIDNQNQQVWQFIPQSGGFYKIKSPSGFYLTQKRVLVPSMDLLTNEDSQLWQLIEAGDGYYYIKSKTNKYLSAADRNKKEGALVSFGNTTAGDNRYKWHLIKWSNDNRKLTTFDPVRNGFHFVNTFSGEDGLKWGGLCGGMVYTALDYFRNRMAIPTQSYTPANQTTLQSYIFARQNHSISNVNEKWSELEVSYNTRGGEIFRWGMQGTGGGRLEQIKNSIDAGISRPIGLFAGGVHGLNGSDGSRHVVLAMGYTMGRYTGNLSGYVGDYKIFAWDPNMRNQMVTIVPDMANQCYFEVESGRAWRTYFVNDRYDNDHVPPAGIPNFPEGEPEGSIRNLYAEFQTGGDDLRGGSDNVSITIRYHDGTQQAFLNVNNGARWVDGTTNTVHLALDRAVRRTDIDNFRITTSFGSGDGSDDWNLDGFSVSSGWNGISFARSWAEPGNYIFRFSGDQGKQMHIVPAVR